MISRSVRSFSNISVLYNSMAPIMASDSTDIPTDKKRYLLIRMHHTHAGDVRNALIRRLSVLHGYRGRCLAIGHEAYPVRNSLRRWNDHLSVAILEFPDEGWLVRWSDSDPDVKQRDWLDGVDMVSLTPLNHMEAVEGLAEPWLCLAETHHPSPYITMEELVTMATEPLSGMGETRTIIQTTDSVYHRGVYKVGTLVVNYCDGQGPCKEVPEVDCSINALPAADVIMYKLQPLCLPLTSDSNPAAIQI